ncbi:MAG: hypothetical protein ACXACH_05635 [Candidatus Hermodarchaeia archaeon]
MEWKGLEIIRLAGAMDEYQLVTNLNLTVEDLQYLLHPLIQQGYITAITKHGQDCLHCSSRHTCPGSRILSQSPNETFSAYRLTSAGMRYRRQLLTAKDEETKWLLVNTSQSIFRQRLLTKYSHILLQEGIYHVFTITNRSIRAPN